MRAREHTERGLQNPLVSLCMIVRDEAPSLRRALESAAPLAEELIVVDTGSVDESREIAVASGAKLREISWPGHFSEARNASLEGALGEWILILDGDEYFSDSLREQVFAAIEQAPEADAFAFQIVHFTSEERRVQEATLQWQVRLFRNLPRYRYEGVVHNQLLDHERGEVLEGPRLPVQVFHSGYLPSVWRRQRKAERITLLERAVDEHPSDPFVHFNLANHLKILRDFKRAGEHYGRSRELTEPPVHLPWHLEAYYAGAFCASQLGAHEDALALCIQAEELAPKLLDIRLRRCEALAELGRHKEALEEAERALADPAGEQRKGWVRGHLRYRAGVSAFSLHDFERARRIFSALWAEQFVNDTVCLYWAISAFEQGDTEEALQAWLEGQRLAPENPDWEGVRRHLEADPLLAQALQLSELEAP